MNTSQNFHDFQEFRVRLDSFPSELGLPQIDWDDGAAQEARSTIDGHELHSECWILATAKNVSILDLEPQEIRQIAWKLFNQRRSTHSPIAQRQALGQETKTEFIACCRRIERIIGKQLLTAAQEEAFLFQTPGELRKHRRCSAPSATVAKQSAELRVSELMALDELLNGDWEGWFQQHASNWQAQFLRTKVWPFVKPGTHGNGMRDRLEEKQASMFKLGIEMLRTAASTGGNAQADLIAQGYHLCVTATYINPEFAYDAVAEMNSAIAPLGRLYRKITERCLHLLGDEEERIKYRDNLLLYLCKNEDEGNFFAMYAAVYFGGATIGSESAFLRQHGQCSVSLPNADNIIQESYANMQEYQYTKSPTLSDINVLRCILMLRKLPIRELLSPTSWYKIRILCQRGRRSTDRRVATLAKEVLENLPTA